MQCSSPFNNKELDLCPTPIDEKGRFDLLFNLHKLGHYNAIKLSAIRPGSHELRHSNYCSNSKSYYEIFSTTTLDYWKNYHDSFGVAHAPYNYEVYCGSASVERTQ